MKAVLWLVGIATILVFIGGFGFIGARIADADRLCVVFQGIMVGGAGVTLLALTIALIVGFYHLYLYWFTDRRPLSLFATTKRDE